MSQIYYFEINYDKNLDTKVRIQVSSRKMGVIYGKVMILLQGLEEKGHCIIMDNF
jgi:hypothetical protein